jgi:uncharacterized protein YbjT (DUF2867 family)
MMPWQPSGLGRHARQRRVGDALLGASVLVDVSNSPSLRDAAVVEFFETSTRNLLDAEVAAGVGRHVALLVVGIQLLSASGYFRAKIAREKLITTSSIPYSIVHAAQFFEFVNSIAQAATDGGTIRLGVGDHGIPSLEVGGGHVIPWGRSRNSLPVGGDDDPPSQAPAQPASPDRPPN